MKRRLILALVLSLIIGCTTAQIQQTKTGIEVAQATVDILKVKVQNETDPKKKAEWQEKLSYAEAILKALSLSVDLIPTTQPEK